MLAIIIEEIAKWHEGDRHLIYSAASAVIISLLFSIKDNKSNRYMLTSSCICAVIAICFNVTLEHMGLNETYSAAFGATIGFIGADKLREIILSLVNKKISS
ncbi:phage holin, lambda family [Rouxiella sp. WC2420]|uniref:Phage holin, lambda family n=1 Tax=Rouxiella sp. WC2420 TaxID=3234145 RepID=A0AB39VW17_9GAMM